jgi:predicted permease
MRNLLQDIRFTFRQMRKAPSFAVTAVLTLALGIGANTAIFSLVNTILLKPLPVDNPSQVTALAISQSKGPTLNFFSWPEVNAIRAQSQRSFSEVIAHNLGMDGLAVAGQQPQRVLTSYVSGNFFAALGLKPAAGRLFLRGEGEVQGSDPILVLDYDYWMLRFNGDASVVGRAVTVDGHPLTVVGVAPKGFHGVQSFVTVAAYLPISQMGIEGISADYWNDWHSRSFNIYGRLRPGASMQQAGMELGLVAQNLMRQQPEAEKNIAISAFPEPSLRISTGDPKQMYVISGIFLSLAVMVLLLACVNVANLVLVRATVREREMAIRTALGAQRSRLLRQMITESVTLALIGGVLGMVLGVWASSALNHINAHADIPLRLTSDFDWRIFLYSFAIALLAGVVVGIVPAVRNAKSNINTVLHEGSRGVSRGRHWFRDSLVALQISGSLVLLVVSGLFLRSLSAMQTMDLGFKPDSVLNIAVDPNEIGLSGAQTHDLAANILARLQQLPGVEAASHATSTPMGYFNNGGDTMEIDGEPPPTNPSAWGAGYNIVTPEYFQTVGIDILRGRGFTKDDDAHGLDVVVISESAARKYWPNRDPIGRSFHMASDKTRKLVVVGIARDAEFQLWGGGKTLPYFYIPYAQHFANNSFMTFQLKTQGNPLALAAAAEKTIHGLAPQLPVFQVQTMREALYTLNGLLLFQIAATLAAIMGGLGLTLAVIGLYGVVSYAVSQRMHEIGLRMALGASRGAVFKMIYRQSVVVVAAGLGIGLAMALLAAQAVGSIVIVSVWEPATYVIVGSILAAAALASCYLPARRAMAVEPMVALRED